MRVNEKISFVHFVYPFLLEAEEFETRAEAIGRARWSSGGKELTVWEPQRFPEEDLLPHVARYLNPPAGIPATARLWKLQGALQDVYGLARRVDWGLHLPRREVPFRWGEVGGRDFAAQLALFRVGVGFLTVRARPTGGEVADWLDFLHYFRFVRGQRGVKVQARRRTGKEQWEAFFPEPAGGVAPHPEGCGVFSEVLEALLSTGTAEGETEPWWREVFVPGQLLPFAVLWVEEVPEEERVPLLYRVRHFFHSRQEIHPSADDLRLDHPALLSYAEGQWFLFSLDGGAFVACNAPETPFFRQTLPHHLRDQYFLLFLLALHERFALMSLSQQVSEQWLRGEEMERAQAFEGIRDALLAFTARGYFTQVMQQEHYHRCYRKWQETFQVERLYQEVSEEVGDMHDYLLMRRTERLQQLAEAEARAERERERAAQERERRLERRLNQIALLLGVPAVGLAYLDAIGPVGWVTGALVVLSSGAVGLLILWGLSRDREEAGNIRKAQTIFGGKVWDELKEAAKEGVGKIRRALAAFGRRMPNRLKESARFLGQVWRDKFEKVKALFRRRGEETGPHA